jgi:glutathione S-transferase
MPKLYHFTLCPFSRRVRLALGEYGEAAELIEEKPWAPTRGFLKLSPSGALPAFVEDDRSAVAGIEAVSEYLEETRVAGGSAPTLLGETPLERAEVRRLVAWFDRMFHRDVSRNVIVEKVERRFAAPEQGGGAPNMQAVRQSLANIRPHLEHIAQLAEERNWLAGDRLSHADLAAAAHLSCLDYLGDVPWSASQGARSWYTRIKSRPAFRPLLADQIRGMPPPRTYADLDF